MERTTASADKELLWKATPAKPHILTIVSDLRVYVTDDRFLVVCPFPYA
jgi:hypothetical protein